MVEQKSCDFEIRGLFKHKAHQTTLDSEVSLDDETLKIVFALKGKIREVKVFPFRDDPL